jgi:hypothetical protein
MRASATKTAFGEIELRFPFNADLRDALKDQIPKRFLRWDPQNRVWRVMGAFGPTAINLLLAHYPRVAVPDDAPRRLPSSPARTTKPEPALPRPPVPFPVVARAAGADQDPLAPLLAVIPCPACHTRYEQPVRVVAETSRTIAQDETRAPELIAVCPHCTTLAVVSFWPAVAPVAVAS